MVKEVSEMDRDQVYANLEKYCVKYFLCPDQS